MKPARRQQALHDADMLDAKLRAAEKPVASVHGYDAQRTLQVIGINRYVRIVQIPGKSDATLANIRLCSQERAAG